MRQPHDAGDHEGDCERGSEDPPARPMMTCDPFHQQFILLGELGKSTFAQVHLARSVTTGKEVAVQIADMREYPVSAVSRGDVDSSKQQDLEHEAFVLRMLGAQIYRVGF